MRNAEHKRHFRVSHSVAQVADSLTAVSIPDEPNTLPAEETARAAQSAGFEAYESVNVLDAINAIIERSPGSRVLICGSLYLAGAVLRENA